MELRVGLSESEALARRASGQGNRVRFRTSRSYLQIFRQNALTFINSTLFGIGIVLILLGQVGDALVTAGLVLLNVAVSVVQEGRAKQKLDRIALLSRPKAVVIRDGRQRAIDPAEVVLGDSLVLRPGDAVVVDGQILGDGTVEVDESLLTGESAPVRKQSGDPLYSGSFCVSGAALYEAQKVGSSSLVSRLTAEARTFRVVKTPLQREIDFIVRLLVVLVTQLALLLTISFLVRGIPVVEGVRIAAVVIGLVPQGLFLMTTVSYALGAVRVAGRGALVQRANAVESTSNVTVLCLDKTGTLTTNRLRLEEVDAVPGPLGLSEAELRRILGDYAASMPAGNRTIEVIRATCAGEPRRLRGVVPFSSERKWSALAFDEDGQVGVFVLGAPEILRPHLCSSVGLERIQERAERGWRVLLFAGRPDAVPLYDREGSPELPRELIPLGVVSLSDELRRGVRETLRRFAALGIELKILSGDNPDAVAVVARQVGLGDRLKVVSGLELSEMEDAQLWQVVKETTIFGRTTPQQKERLVRLLKEQGNHVAMVGDGVNDILPMKQAHLGIAMQSGSPATRSVADMVLLGDSFRVLPVAFREGQRIIKAMEDIVRLLLTRTLYVLLLILAARVVGVDFPVTPKHNSILAVLTVGIPIVALAAWARPGKPSGRITRATSHFVFPAAFSISLVSLAIYLFYLEMTGDVDIARTALTTVGVLCGLVLISFVEPPTEAWVGGDVLSGDWRPTLLSLGMLLCFGVVMALPWLRTFFELVPLRWADYVLIGAAVFGWGVLLREIWRRRWFERIVALEEGQGPTR